MGNICESLNCDFYQPSTADDDLQMRSIVLDRMLEEDGKKEKDIIKLLLLGAGECGKSTVLKQMRIIHDNGFTYEELMSRRSAIYSSIIDATFCLINGMETFDLPMKWSDSSAHASLICEFKSTGNMDLAMPEPVYLALSELWQDPGVQEAFKRRAEFYVPDCTKYFFDHLERIAGPEYCPSTQDVLFLRVPTIGIVEVKFTIRERIWKVFDVGGQKSQRKKWIHCFDNVQAILFIAAMSDFDQVMLEDMATNRLQDSIQLFGEICNNKFFVKSSIIVFLNKKDIFEEKLKCGHSIRMAFAEYNGQDTFAESSNYIEQKFLKMKKETLEKSIYFHQTCATDTEQVQAIVSSTMDTIFKARINSMGLM